MTVQKLSARTMRGVLGLMVLGVLGLGWTHDASGEVLASRNFNSTFGTSSQPTGEFLVEFGLAGTPEGPTAGDPLVFEALTFSVGDVGQSFTLTRDDDPDVDTVAATLTNGVDDPNLTFFLGANVEDTSSGAINRAGNGLIQPESAFFGRDASSPDFQGFVIDSFTIVINEADFAINSGSLNDVEFDVTLLVNGTPVPEASAAFVWLLGVGVIARRATRQAS